MVEPAAGRARWRWAWRAAVVLVVAYAALVRLTILFDRYGPFDHPRWIVALERSTDAIRPALVPAWWAVPRLSGLDLRHLHARVAVGVARLQANRHRAQVELTTG